MNELSAVTSCDNILVRLAPQLATATKTSASGFVDLHRRQTCIGSHQCKLFKKCIHGTDQYTLGNVFLDPIYHISLAIVPCIELVISRLNVS